MQDQDVHLFVVDGSVKGKTKHGVKKPSAMVRMLMAPAFRVLKPNPQGGIWREAPWEGMRLKWGHGDVGPVMESAAL